MGLDFFFSIVLGDVIINIKTYHFSQNNLRSEHDKVLSIICNLGDKLTDLGRITSYFFKYFKKKN